MRITKFGHACLRVEHDGTTVVIDPGTFSEPESVDGADAILITHEHADHVDPKLLDRAGAPVFTIDAVAATLSPAHREATTVVKPIFVHSLGCAGVPRQPEVSSGRSTACVPIGSTANNVTHQIRI